MGIIKSIIPKQNFELVNERIGEILKLELEEQKALQGFSEPLNIYTERMDAFKHSEILLVNTFFDAANNNTHSQKSSQGNVVYFIDITTSGASGDGKDGGNDSSSRCNKFLGMVRYIMSHSAYRTLGFEPGTIGGVYIENIQKADSEQMDAAYVSFARITVSVKLREDQPLLTGELMKSTLTGVKLDLTEQGYKYELTN